jgi:hypothetical protein
MKSLLWMVIAVLIAAPALAGDVVVIVHKDNTFPVSKNLVMSFYAGEGKMWPGGHPLALFDLPADSAERAAFDKNYLGKSVHQMKELWSQNVMSGKATPPKELASDEEVKKAVSQSRFAVGYISAEHVDATVKVVAKD